MDPPECSTSYTRSFFAAETWAWQNDRIIWFGFYYSFNLLNNSFSPLRSSEIRINTSSWIQMYAKDKLGLQGMMHLQRHVPQEYQSQHSLLICISWAQEPNPCYILAEPRENTGKPEGISWSHWNNISLTTSKLESITQKMLREDFAPTSKPHGFFVKKGGYHIIPSFKIRSLHKAFQCFGLTSCPAIWPFVRLSLCYSMPYDNNSN